MARMEGISLDDVAAAHPEAHVFSVEGVLYAEVTTESGDAYAHAYTPGELAAKLDG